MKKKILTAIFLYITIVISNLPLCAQEISVDVRIAPPFIFIGQQTELDLEITQQSDKQSVTFPFFSGEIIPGIEIVEPLKIDSSRSPDNLLIVKHHYKISSFEDSLFYLPSLAFVVDKDTFWSKPVSLKVIQPFDIDTVSNALTDIKPTYTPPFYWGDVLRKTFFAILVLLLLVGIYWLIRKTVRKLQQSQDSPLAFSEPELPAHIVAIERLKQIENEKAWEHGAVKETFTDLTNTIRIYFSKRFEFNASEMTSEEILQALSFMRKTQKELYSKLSSFLERADRVKFAKFKPLVSETEQSIRDAYLFVEQTKKEELKEKEGETPPE